MSKIEDSHKIEDSQLSDSKGEGWVGEEASPRKSDNTTSTWVTLWEFKPCNYNSKATSVASKRIHKKISLALAMPKLQVKYKERATKGWSL